MYIYWYFLLPALLLLLLFFLPSSFFPSIPSPLLLSPPPLLPLSLLTNLPAPTRHSSHRIAFASHLNERSQRRCGAADLPNQAGTSRGILYSTLLYSRYVPSSSTLLLRRGRHRNYITFPSGPSVSDYRIAA